MKKNILIACAAFLCAAGVFAAGKDRVELKVWESQGPESEFIQYAIKAYRKVNPKVKIRYESVSVTDSRAKIELDGPAGVGADVFVAPHDTLGALVSGGHILPVDDAQKYLSNFFDMAKTGSTYKGVVFGYPMGAETYALFYNKDLVKNVPATWEDVEAFSKTFNSKAENKFALVWSVADAYYDFMFLDSFGSHLFGPNGDDYRRHNLNSPEAVRAMRYFQGLRKKILDVPAADITSDVCDSLFISGKAAMIITGPWKIADFKVNGVNFGITSLPGFKDVSKNSGSFSGVRLAFVSSYSEHPEAAKDFARFITSREMLSKRFEITSQIPPRNDIDINDPLSSGIKEQLKYAKAMPTIPQLGTYWSAMGATYSGIWDGDDVKSALDAAAATMDAAK